MPNTHRRRDSTVNDDCRRIRSTIWKLNIGYIAVWLRELWSILITFFNNDVIMTSLVTNLSSSTAQEIVNWATTTDGCVHIAHTTQLDLAVGKFVQTSQDCGRLWVANSVHTAVATKLDSLVASAVCIWLNSNDFFPIF